MKTHVAGTYRLERNDQFFSDDFPLVMDLRTFHKQDKNMELNRDSKLHWHDFFEIEYLVKGSCLHIVNNLNLTIGHGSAYVITPIDFHNLFCIGDSFQMYHIAFESSALSQDIINCFSNLDSVITADFNPQERIFIETQLQFLLEEFKEHHPESKFIIRAGIEEILMLILRKSSAKKMSGNNVHNDASPVIQQAVSYLRLHFRNPIHLYDIAQMFHLSSNYFGELFYHSMGMSFNNYITGIRLEYAKSLLSSTQLTISEVCYESGFHTVSHFINEFRKKYGETPNHMRTALNSRESDNR